MKKFIIFICLLSINYNFAQSVIEEKKSIENLINKASEFFQKCDYENSLKCSQNALLKSFKINDDYFIAHSYNLIGAVYNEFSNSKRAIGFYQKALSHANNIDDSHLKSWIYGNLGSVYYYNLNDAKKGIEYYKKGLIYANNNNDKEQINYTKLSIVAAYFSINDFKNGMVYMNEVKDFTLNKANDDAKISYNNLLGAFNSNNNQPKVAEEYYSKSVTLANKPENQSHLINIYQNLAIHYNKYGNIDKYKFYDEKSKALSAIQYSKDKQSKLDSSAVQIELNIYKFQLEKIELAYEIQKQKNKNFIIVNTLSAIIFVILLGLIFTLYQNNVFRKKYNNELLQRNEELKIAKDKAEIASQLKTQFVSTITHELRTPLYGVVGITNIIIDEHKELADSPYLNSLKFSANYLLELVNDILQMNKIEEKLVVLENETFNIRKEINTIINSVNYIATNNNNKIVLEIDEAIPELFLGDKLRLSQIIMNLITNALKFTKDGVVKLSLNQLKIEDSIHSIEFKICDNGVGIDPKDQNSIFDMFVQVGRKDDDYQGTGLGLAIVKKLVELYGSTIHLESELNKGTTFMFTINFKIGQISKDNENSTFEIKRELKNDLKVLVVEDNKINQMVTKKIMEKNNIQYDIVDDGFTAIDFLKSNVYDVILMDINMPLINGFETTKIIRNNGIQTPIIALTAFDKEEISIDAYSSGMNNIIIKPFEPIKLFEMIHQMISN